MTSWIRFVDPANSLEVYGVRFVGINAVNGRKFLLSILFIAAVLVLSGLLRRVARWAVGGRSERVVFWVRQAIQFVTLLLLVITLVSLWFDDPSRLATAMGLVTAGLAFALQKVVTSFAGYLVLLRGKTFSVGDRITMGGVRGDVVGLGFIQTTIMEMGQPPAEQTDEPAMWIKSRQYTGRIVTVSNDKIFDTPVYNYTRDFPYIWEEMSLPINYKDDRTRAERILLEAAQRHAIKTEKVTEEDLQEMERRFKVQRKDLEPRLYWRLTDNWLEMTVRFITLAHGVREIKDMMSREIIAALDEAGIGLASATYDIVGLPPVRVIQELPVNRELAGENGKPRQA